MATSLVKGTNSYATVAEAQAYFDNRLDVAAWTDATADEKAQALVTATRILDEMPWTGTAVSETQSLAFPRDGSYFDPRLGTTVTFTATPPDRTSTAAIELAYHLLNNDGLLDDSGVVKDLTVSSVQLTHMLAPNLIPSIVRRSIKPLLINAGSQNWWRAN